MTERDDVPPVEQGGRPGDDDVDTAPARDSPSAPDSASAPGSAMGTGSDAGTPGEHLDERPLTDDEVALLGDLSQDGPDVVDDVVEESPGVPAAADDDSPLPPERLDLAAGAGDGDTPRFREP